MLADKLKNFISTFKIYRAEMIRMVVHIEKNKIDGSCTRAKCNGHLEIITVLYRCAVNVLRLKCLKKRQHSLSILIYKRQKTDNRCDKYFTEQYQS